MREWISDSLRDKVLKRDGYKCRYCGRSDRPLELDHVYPVSKGGETTEDNLVTACDLCNGRKSASVGIWPKPLDYLSAPEFLFTRRPTGVILFPIMASIPAAYTYVYRTVNINGGCVTPPIPYDTLIHISTLSFLAGLLIAFGIWLGWNFAAANLNLKARKNNEE